MKGTLISTGVFMAVKLDHTSLGVRCWKKSVIEDFWTEVGERYWRLRKIEKRGFSYFAL